MNMVVEDTRGMCEARREKDCCHMSLRSPVDANKTPRHQQTPHFSFKLFDVICCAVNVTIRAMLLSKETYQAIVVIEIL